jgi:hypothetical protein
MDSLKQESFSVDNPGLFFLPRHGILCRFLNWARKRLGCTWLYLVVTMAPSRRISGCTAVWGMFLTMSSGPATFKDKELQVVGKLSAEKPGHANGIAQTLRKIWCSIKGTRCRDWLQFIWDNFPTAGGKEKGYWGGSMGFFLINFFCWYIESSHQVKTRLTESWNFD